MKSKKVDKKKEGTYKKFNEKEEINLSDSNRGGQRISTSQTGGVLLQSAEAMNQLAESTKRREEKELKEKESKEKKEAMMQEFRPLIRLMFLLKFSSQEKKLPVKAEIDAFCKANCLFVTGTKVEQVCPTNVNNDEVLEKEKK